MALKDRIYVEITETIKRRLAEWRDERQGLLAGAARVVELDAMIAEAEKELILARIKVPLEERP